MSGFFGGGGDIKTGETPLSSFKIQTSAYGGPIPILYGRNRVPGNLLDYDDFAAIPHTTSTSTGGKGGGGQTVENTTYTYQAGIIVGLTEGAITSFNGYWNDKAAYNATALASTFNKFLGNSTQTAWSTWTSKHPSKALAYRGISYAAAGAFQLNSSASLGNLTFDLTGISPFNAGTIDGADPKVVITDYLSNAEHGARFSASYFGDWTAYSQFCVANSLFISPLYDTRQEARQAITDLMQLTNSGVFFSEGLLKIVPYSDTSVTGNGVTYTANTTPSYALTDDDFLDLQQPVKVTRTPTADAFNQVSVEFFDKTAQYNPAVATAEDAGSVALYGANPMQQLTAHCLTDSATARFVAQMILQRILYTRNVYEFRVSLRYGRLEPCDYVTLTDTRVGLSAVPVRVLSVEEDELGTLTIQAEDAPSGVSSALAYNWQDNNGTVVDYSVSAGNCAAPMFFEVPAPKALGGLQVGVAVAGNSNDWGGCDVWAQLGNGTYAFMKTVIGSARYGTITANVTAAANQVARLSASGNVPVTFVSATAQEANAMNSLCVLEDEYVNYTTANLVSTNVYDLTLAERGNYNTTAVAHNSGANMIRIDDAIVYSDPLDLTYIGRTVNFKFLSFNRWGGGAQALSDVNAYAYTIRGYMTTLVPPIISGLGAVSSQNSIIVTWTNAFDQTTVDRVEVWRSTSNNVNTSTLVGSVRGPVGVFADYLGASGLTEYYWIRTVNPQGYPSAYLGPVSATTGVVTAVPGSNSITAAMIQADAVTANAIAANAVTNAKIAASAVGSTQIQANAITANLIAANAVTTTAIAANAIVSNLIAANAVSAGKIAANAVTAGTIATNAVTTNTIAANAVSAGQIAADAVTATAIAAGAVVAGKIATNAVTAGTIAANTISAGDGVIANLAVSTLLLQDQAVTIPVSSSNTSTGSIWTSNIAAVSATIVSSGAPILIEGMAVVASTVVAGDVKSFSLQLKIGSTVILTAYGTLPNPSTISQTIYASVPFVFSHTPGAGSKTYTLYRDGSGGFGSVALALQNASLALLETKK